MNILQIANYIVPQIKIEPILALMASQEPEHIDLANCIASAGQEIATRVEWPQMRISATLVGTGNARILFDNDFSRLIKGRSVTYLGGTVRGGLSSEEFNNLAPVAGVPRYFRLSGAAIELWPYITAPDSISVTYISKGWLAGNKQAVTLDTDTPLFDDYLLIKGAEWRWRRMKGQDYKDQLDEFEAEMAKQSGFSVASRSP